MKYFEVNFQIKPYSEDYSDILAALLSEYDYESFAPTANGVTAYILQNKWNEKATISVIEEFPIHGVNISYSKSEAPDEDWNKIWEEEGFEPIIIEDKIAIHDIKHTNIPSVEYEIIISPKQAFGTGSHQTTRMILKELYSMNLTGKNIIDAGTGTGVLAIMAIKRNAKKVLAYDIDDWSVENAKDNLLLNHIYSQVEVKLGDSRQIQEEKNYDLLIANINRNILIKDLGTFKNTLSEHGYLLLSGFYTEDVMILEKEAISLGLKLIKTETEDNWAMLLFETDATSRMNV